MSDKNTTRRRVRDVMSSDVVSLHAENTVHDALNMLVENCVSALPVVDKSKHCIGILSTTDLIDITRDVDEELLWSEELDATSKRWLIERLIHTIGNEPLATYMTEDLTTVYAEDSLVKAAREMLRNRVHHLPVVDKKEKLVGILSTMDILAEFAELSN